MLILLWSVLAFFKATHRWLYWKKVFSKPCSYQFAERNEEASDWGGRLPPCCEQGPPSSSRGQWRAASDPGWHPCLPDFTRTAHGAREVRHGYLAIYVVVCSTGTCAGSLIYVTAAGCYSLNLLDWIWKVVLTIGLHPVMFLFCVSYESESAIWMYLCEVPGVWVKALKPEGWWPLLFLYLTTETNPKKW